eukprot:GDKI01036777.1.p1 GENE.GDKI01036777.1~~GDKI01036777.1.p1  ORF type:complete len:446 (-),score=78.64 GDKI01036777.1:50-1387(-)
MEIPRHIKPYFKLHFVVLGLIALYVICDWISLKTSGPKHNETAVQSISSTNAPTAVLVQAKENEQYSRLRGQMQELTNQLTKVQLTQSAPCPTTNANPPAAVTVTVTNAPSVPDERVSDMPDVSVSESAGLSVADTLEPYRRDMSEFCDHTYLALKDSLPPFMSIADARLPYQLSFSAQKGRQFKAPVYKKGDIVSDMVKRSGMWEESNIATLLNTMSQYAQQHNLAHDQITLVDIGANIGFFTLSAAMAGFKVIAFEPNADNELLLRMGVCINELTDKIILVNKGLGDAPKRCRLMSVNDNVGDSFMDCDDNSVKGFSGAPHNEYVRSIIDIVRIDDVLPTPLLDTMHVAAFKMDVEGFEHVVLGGGIEFFSHPRLRFGQTEVSKGMGGTNPGLVFDRLTQAGFAQQRLRSFQGAPGSLQSMNGDRVQIDVFVYKSAGGPTEDE